MKDSPGPPANCRPWAAGLGRGACAILLSIGASAAAAQGGQVVLTRIVDEPVRCRSQPHSSVYFFAADRTVSMHTYEVLEGKTRILRIMGGRYSFSSSDEITTQYVGLYDDVTKRWSVVAGSRQAFKVTAADARGSSFRLGNEPCEVVETVAVKQMHDALRARREFFGP